jgi:acyl-CoA dehydrogenase
MNDTASFAATGQGSPLPAGSSPFTEEEAAFRSTVRKFLDRELEPNAAKFVGNLDYDKAFWRKAGAAGLLGTMIPETYGGPGASDACGVITAQELGRSIGGATVGLSLCADMCTRMLMIGGTEEQKRKFAPGILSGEITPCMPLTEPDAGSDATAIRATATREGEHYVINGSKVFITNGNKAGLMYVVAKTDPTKRGSGMSMFLVEGNTPGISRHPMKTMGYDAYDVAELHFDNLRVPAANLLLGEGRGLEIVMSTFLFDRLEISARALGEAELAFRLALDHVRVRKAFGKTLFEFQNTQFKLADMKTEIEVGRAFLYDGIRKQRAGELDFAGSSMLKLWITEMSGRVVDNAMQMFGGSGFMDEMPISKLYRCNRLHRLYAGASELLKIAIARALPEQNSYLA